MPRHAWWDLEEPMLEWNAEKYRYRECFGKHGRYPVFYWIGLQQGIFQRAQVCALSYL
jgi:hypothetical protein